MPDHGAEPALERDMSVEIHRGSAELYDTSTAWFWHYRSLAVERLRLHPGEVVVDVGCGTGLCFPMIERRIGRQGRLIGIEPCPEMMGRAARRVDAHRWSNVTLVREPAEKATLPVACDGALFCATHDILRSSIALKNVLGQLRSGGRAVAIGSKWAPAWMPALNFGVLALHRPWARTFEGLERPWSQMEQLVGDLRVETLALGAGFVAWGTCGRDPTSSPAEDGEVPRPRGPLRRLPTSRRESSRATLDKGSGNAQTAIRRSEKAGRGFYGRPATYVGI